MVVYIQTNQPFNLPNANLVISAADSGKIMLFINVTGARTYTLPALQAGLHYRFINMAPGGLGANVIIQGTGGAGNTLLNGVLLKGAAVCTAVTARSALNFVNGQSIKGDLLL